MKLRMPQSAVSEDPGKPPPQQSYKLNPASYVHHRANLPVNPPVVATTRQKMYSQIPKLSPVQGQAGFVTEAQVSHSGNTPSAEGRPHHGNDIQEALQQEETHDPEPTMYQRKKLSQWTTWRERVVPELVSPFLNLFAQTKSLARYDNRHEYIPLPCACGRSVKTIDVFLLGFLSIDSCSIKFCKCNTASSQLVSRGYFPCSPVEPTLAIDIRVLEFVSRLFSEISPNHTAWAQAVEGFLGSMGHKLETENSLRRRFQNAYRWYRHLKATIQHDMAVKIEESRVKQKANQDNTTVSQLTHDGVHASLPPRSPLQLTVAPPPHVSPPGPSKRRIDNCDPPGYPFPEPPARDRPSEYLRKRCPACFGGEYPPKDLRGPYVNVQGDACFTQKRNKGKGIHDPKLTHPATVFIPEEDVIKMRDFVEKTRSGTSTKRPKRTDPPPDKAEEADTVEAGMKLPNSVLDGCESSFTAADERREKASTQFFDDTGLMALLCRHDRVLWMVNMRSAGEKQYFMFILIETLFQHLPLDAVVGFLYDVSCALERSCLKWGFLKRYIHRLVFGVSVFHAFGHQWACQLVYHPRKRTGFGLFDGEGAERFWSSLRKLIAPLRVSGSHERRYVLDSQIQYDLSAGLLRLGRWLYRRMLHYQAKRNAAEKVLNECGHEETFLRKEWKEQIKVQTLPLPRRSSGAGRKAVEETLRLQTTCDSLKEKAATLRRELIKAVGNGPIFASVSLELDQSSKDLQLALDRLKEKRDKLGIEDKVELQQLTNNRFLQLRMNAIALKTRIREKLRSRKFELHRIEREYRKQRNDKKLDDHTKASIERRDPSIQQLARSYNDLCTSMTSVIQKGEAPPGAKSLEPLVTKGLFNLDIDDAVWNSLDNLSEAGVEPPLWSCEESVRNGISALLELDRCVEEEERICYERQAVQVWFSEEWDAVNSTIESTAESGIQYYLRERRNSLLHLHSIWSRELNLIQSGSADIPNWGPSSDDMRNINTLRFLPRFGNGSEDDVDENEEEAVEQLELDLGMLMILDTLDTKDSEDTEDMEASE